MGYKRTLPTMYIVHWPKIGVVKAGYTCNQRWRAFEARGAEVVDLVECADFRDALALEILVDAVFRNRCGKRGFRSKKAATPYLGNNGGGWLECWSLPSGVTPMMILNHTNWEAA